MLRRVRAVNDVLYSVGNLFQGASARVIRLPGPRPSDACAASSVPIRRWSRFFTSTPARFVLTGGENERAAVDLLLHGALGFCTVVHRPQSSSASRRTLFDLGAHSRQEKARGVMTKVLYVEDNEDNVYMLKMRLELLGDFEVLTAERRRRPEAKLTRRSKRRSWTPPMTRRWRWRERVRAKCCAARSPISPPTTERSLTSFTRRSRADYRHPGRDGEDAHVLRAQEVR